MAASCAAVGSVTDIILLELASISPEPFGERTRSPFVSSVIIVLPFIFILSTVSSPKSPSDVTLP